MSENIVFVPRAKNEPVKGYLPGSPEREEIIKAVDEVYSNVKGIPMFIGGKEVKSDKIIPIVPPHKINHKIGEYYQGSAEHVNMAIDAALAARASWAGMCWKQRASIFLKAASLLAGPYRAKINAATMIGQSKTVHQAEIDAACEIIDFLRFNVQYMEEIYNNQPESSEHVWNRIEQRPLEGFVFALTPFNFTSIAGNLPTAPAIMGNVVVWKASKTQVYSASVLMDVFREAGVPDGVINLVFASGPVIGDIVLNHPDFAGIHFTGSTAVFNGIWKTVGNNIDKYKTYPRLVGETGGKDFVMVHPSANAQQVVTALTRGAFEYQGQKCSAASRAYIPESMWGDVKAGLEADLKSIKMGAPEDFTNFMCAIIDETSFDLLAGYIERAKEDKDAEVIIGGKCDKSEGYYIEPTVIQANDPKYITMVEELFGPVLTIYVYKDDKFEETLDLLDETSPYG
ncbi:MAG: L-glutamate gamma-semialdehyde dehydrogenase, partial [Bacteroidales bacterium]|nr:L-glutamate gamma-semialdehyde dehydrogenase [Bacteroidales bacterium]